MDRIKSLHAENYQFLSHSLFLEFVKYHCNHNDKFSFIHKISYFGPLLKSYWRKLNNLEGWTAFPSVLHMFRGPFDIACHQSPYDVDTGCLWLARTASVFPNSNFHCGILSLYACIREVCVFVHWLILWFSITQFTNPSYFGFGTRIVLLMHKPSLPFPFILTQQCLTISSSPFHCHHIDGSDYRGLLE